MLRTFFSALVLGTSSLLAAQTHASGHHSNTHRASAEDAAERLTAQAFDDARNAGALALHAFLQRMPKGGDLHMHLSGAVYAETFLKDAAEDGLCVDTLKLRLVKSVGSKEGTPAQPVCPEGALPATAAFKDQHLYDALVDSLSMRSFVPSAGVSAHDQFFATFERANGIDKRHTPEWMDEAAARAAAQNEQYLEVMLTPPFTHAATLGYQIGWPTKTHLTSESYTSVAPEPDGTSTSELTALRDKLLASGLRDEVAIDRAQIDGDLAARRKLERCGQPNAAPACAVEVRVLYQVLRAFPPQQVFAQTLLGFELASVDANVVGINFVQPEDAYMAMSEYHRQMRMLGYLHSVYPRVHIALHAGELAPGLVPPAGLRFHIREAVDIAHAERIGHGADVMYETDPALLLAELADRHIIVEINLTSNNVILGVKPSEHPLPNYRAAHVPVALSTDDEGVSRSDLTHEYTRAAIEYHLNYAELKAMVRTSLEHTFLPGVSLWARADDFTRASGACSGQTLGAETPTGGCLAFLRSSPHATQQWELEHRFRVFESMPLLNLK